MSVGDTTLTVVGNLTADPDLRFTQSGIGVVAFTVAATRRVFNRDAGKWEDGDTLFLRCSAWRHLADHVAESLTKGTRVIVTGRLRQRDYEDKEGIKRTVYEVDVEEVGPSLRYATAKVVKAARTGFPHPADTANGTTTGSGNTGPGEDPWARSTDSAGGYSADPPF